MKTGNSDKEWHKGKNTKKLHNEIVSGVSDWHCYHSFESR
jgi:hypothetical protein